MEVLVVQQEEVEELGLVVNEALVPLHHDLLVVGADRVVAHAPNDYTLDRPQSVF